MDETAVRALVYFAAVCRCFPGKAPGGGDRVPAPNEIRNCSSWMNDDVLFNNAGICAYGLAHELTEDAWDAMLDINLKGSWLVARRVIPIMLRQRGTSVHELDVYRWASIAGAGVATSDTEIARHPDVRALSNRAGRD